MKDRTQKSGPYTQSDWCGNLKVDVRKQVLRGKRTQLDRDDEL